MIRKLVDTGDKLAVKRLIKEYKEKGYKVKYISKVSKYITAVGFEKT